MVDDPSPDDLSVDEDELHTTMESEVDAVLPDFEDAASPRVEAQSPADPSSEDDDDEQEAAEGQRPSRPPLSAPPRPVSKRGPSSTIPRPRGKAKPTPLGLTVPSSTRPLSSPPRPASSRPPSKKPSPSKGPSSKQPSSNAPPAPDETSSASPKSVPPTIDESDWLAPKDVAPEGMFASGDYPFERSADDPFASRGGDEAPGLDAPTVKMSALRDLDIGAYDDPHDDDPVLEEDAFDGAKTQKLHRPDLDELRRVGAELGLVEEGPEAAPATDADGLPTPSDDAESGPEEADPEEALVDDLDAPTMVVEPESPPEAKKPRKRKSRRGRKRTALKIPDDATPMPPPVALAEMTPDTPEERERAPSGEFLEADAIEELPEPDARPEPPKPPPPRDRLQTLTGNGPSSPPPPPRREPDDEVTLLRPSPALQKALEASGAISPPDEPEAASSPPEEVDEAAPDEHPSEPAPTGEERTSSPDMTPSAPGVMTDQTSIGIVRPIQVVSDLPAVEELKQRTIEAAMGHNAPPFEIEPGPDSAEEIDPEPAASPPGPPPNTPVPGEGSASQRRPPPPRRGSESSLEKIEEIEPDRMSLPAQRNLPPPRSGEPPPAMTQAEADLALAEARAREAQAKAREAAARAAEADAKAKAARPPKKPWWAEMFEGDLIRTLDNPRKLDVEKETAFIAQCLRLPKGSRVLDLACGNGVHAVELSSHGFQVVGVDYSEKMLDLARAYNTQRGTSVSFIQGDMRKLNLEGVFDGIYCWSSSFGYFDESTNANVLERIARAVRPGGTFALDIDNRDFVAPRAPQMAWFEKPGVVCMDEMRFDYYSSRMLTRRMAIFEDQAPREIETTIRLYTLRELGRLLQKVGFKILEVSGHRATRGAYFGDVSPRIIISCQRTEDD